MITAKQASLIASLAAINTAASSTMARQAAQMTTFLASLSLTIADSIINDNSGPGVDNNAGFVTIIDTTISGNSVGKTGGQSDVGGGVYTYHGRWENSGEPHRYEQHDQW